jgi:hypothetical protein
MAAPESTTPLDQAAAEQLSARFHDIFRTFEPDEDLFTPDVLFDLNMPVWRFQLQGAGGMAAQLRKSSGDGVVWVEVSRVVPTATGFVAEHEEHQELEGRHLSARRLVLCELRDGRIAKVTSYCSGEWDDELRARHAVEAPMIRP